MSETAIRPTKTGVVVKKADEKTATILVSTLIKHPRYHKIIKRSKKYLSHIDSTDVAVGDKVEITSCRPISKRKSWRVTKIVTKHSAIDDEIKASKKSTGKNKS